MRVTFDVLRDGLPAIQSASEQLARAQQQVASGRRLRAPSDDPLATRQAIGEHAQIGTIDAYSRSANAASSRLAAADSTLSDIIDKLTSALATTTGARGNTADQASRDAAAETIRGILDALAGDVNSEFQGTSLFAGSKVTTTAYALVAGSWVYQGDAVPVQVDVEQGRRVTTAFDGQALMQGSDPSDILTVLGGLVTAVQTGDQATMASGIDALQRAFSRATQLQSRLGADESGIFDASARLSDLRIAAETRRSREEDADMAGAIARVNQADVAYRAALGAVSGAERVSLLDYLR